jgi:hypothetical protein
MIYQQPGSATTNMCGWLLALSASQPARLRAPVPGGVLDGVDEASYYRTTPSQMPLPVPDQVPLSVPTRVPPSMMGTTIDGGRHVGCGERAAPTPAPDRSRPGC